MNYGMNRTGDLPADPTGKSQSKRGGGRGDVIPKGYRAGKMQQFTPEAMELYQRLFGLVGEDSDLFRMASGDESKFNEIEAPEMRRFNDLLGGISTRFSGQGLGGRHSSGFQNTATAAGSNFAQDLASRRSDLMRQAIQDLRGMSSDLLSQRPYEQFVTQKRQKEPGFWDTFGQSLARSAGESIGSFGQGDSGGGGGRGGADTAAGDAAKMAAFLA